MEPGEIHALHQALVDELKQRECILSPRIEAAFRAIPRHLFLPDVPPNRVYQDVSVATKRVDGKLVSSSSQPCIMAIMLEQLQLEPGQRMLEIGTGTGYNAALMAHIAGDAGQVVTVDIDEDIVDAARAHLRGAGLGHVQIVCRDGALGYQEAAPFDRIILTAGSWDIAPAWYEQLKPGGRLVLPLALAQDVQLSVAFEHVGDHLASVSTRDCGFMMLRGALAHAEESTPLGSEPGLSMTVIGKAVDADAIYALLTGPRRAWPTAIQVTPAELGAGIRLWLALQEPGYCNLSAEGQLAARGMVPWLFRYASDPPSGSTYGLLDDSGLCLLMPPPDRPPPSDNCCDAESFELWVSSFGSNEQLAQRLLRQLAAWQAAGRPVGERFHIRAYPPGWTCAPSLTRLIVARQWAQLVLDWQ